MSDRPKLLFLACYFPPVQMSASVRTWNIAKYLARLGWDVTVVTPEPSLWRNVEDPETVSMELDREGIRRIFTGHGWQCLLPDDFKCWNAAGIGWVVGGICRRIVRFLGVEISIGWINEVEHACELLTGDQVDVILASGPPFASFLLAKRLSQKLSRPYVLDYRDPWQVYYAKARPSVRTRVQRLERDIVKRASAVIAISESLLDGQSCLTRNLHIITNGFDPDEMSKVRPHEYGHFAIVYAGIFHPPKRVITPVMAALKLLKQSPISNRIPWGFHYYGPQGDDVRRQAENFDVMDRVFLHGRVNRSEALSAVRGAGVAVVITSVHEEKAVKDGGIVTGKLFEPLGLRVPVLVVGPLGGDVETISKTTGLTRIVPAKDLNGIVSFFTEVMLGEAPEAKAPDAYAWPRVIQGIDDVLRRAIGGRCSEEMAARCSQSSELLRSL